MKKLIAVLAVVALMSGAVASADVMSVDVTVNGSTVYSGKPNNSIGLGFAQTGSWIQTDWATNESGTKSVTNGTVTFSVQSAGRNNAGGIGAGQRQAGLYSERDWASQMTWKYSGLTPGSTVDIVMYGFVGNGTPPTFNVFGGAWGTPDSEGDTDFENVTVDVNGEVYGLWRATGASGYCGIGATQIQYTLPAAVPVPEMAGLALLGVGLLALRRRRA